jgi:uncharacterized DUF497 family protein
MIFFEWDPVKARTNQRKHRVSFDIAQHVFDDPDALADHDLTDDGEDRWRTLGSVGGVLLLLVAHTVRFENEEDQVIRIISARRADRKEKQHYEKQRQENRAR